MPVRSIHVEWVCRAEDIRQDVGIVQRRANFPGKDKILADLRAAAIAYDKLVAMEEGRS